MKRTFWFIHPIAIFVYSIIALALSLFLYIYWYVEVSSGLQRVKIYDANGVPSNRGVGMFAMAFMKHFPLVPVEEDARLNDRGLRVRAMA